MCVNLHTVGFYIECNEAHDRKITTENKKTERERISRTNNRVCGRFVTKHNTGSTPEITENYRTRNKITHKQPCGWTVRYNRGSTPEITETVTLIVQACSRRGIDNQQCSICQDFAGLTPTPTHEPHRQATPGPDCAPNRPEKGRVEGITLHTNHDRKNDDKRQSSDPE